MGIPTVFLWEWDGNGNSIPTATVLIVPPKVPAVGTAVILDFILIFALK